MILYKKQCTFSTFLLKYHLHKKSKPMNIIIKSAFVVLCFSVVSLLSSFSNTDEQPKLLKVELTLNEWSEVFDIMDKSTAPHTRVMEVAGKLNKQLTPQLPKDSTHKK